MLHTKALSSFLSRMPTMLTGLFRLHSPRLKSQQIGKITIFFILFIQASAALYLSVYLRAVPTNHIIFVISVTSYAAFSNQFLRRSLSLTQDYLRLQPRGIAPMRQSTRLLFPFTICFSLLVPALLLYVTRGLATKLDELLCPHLFLMIIQIFLETIGHLNSSTILLYVRLGVTIAFVSYRLQVIWTWYQNAAIWAETEEALKAPSYVIPLTQAAAVLNFVFWSFSLLCFLLLYCLPAIIRDPQKIIIDPPQTELVDMDNDKQP